MRARANDLLRSVLLSLATTAVVIRAQEATWRLLQPA